MAEERVANRPGEKNAAERQTGPGRIESVHLLQKERTKRAHAIAGEVAQTESETGPQEKNPERGRGEKSVGRPRLSFRGGQGSFFVREPGEQTRGDQAEQTKLEHRPAPGCRAQRGFQNMRAPAGVDGA